MQLWKQAPDGDYKVLGEIVDMQKDPDEKDFLITLKTSDPLVSEPFFSLFRIPFNAGSILIEGRTKWSLPALNQQTFLVLEYKRQTFVPADQDTEEGETP